MKIKIYMYLWVKIKQKCISLLAVMCLVKTKITKNKDLYKIHFYSCFLIILIFSSLSNEPDNWLSRLWRVWSICLEQLVLLPWGRYPDTAGNIRSHRQYCCQPDPFNKGDEEQFQPHADCSGSLWLRIPVWINPGELQEELQARKLAPHQTLSSFPFSRLVNVILYIFYT